MLCAGWVVAVLQDLVVVMRKDLAHVDSFPICEGFDESGDLVWFEGPKVSPADVARNSW